MPPRLPSASRVRLLLKKGKPNFFFCPSCSIWRLVEPPKLALRALRSPQWRSLASKRYASTLASSTAINAPIEVTPRYRELYQALEGLKHSAANYVNLSRLQLALRGLETRDAVVRVAVLSLGDEKAARQLVRLLLADPLATAENWEKRLETVNEGDERGLLIRYGAEDDIAPPNPLLRTLLVPSKVLQRNNLEILISSLNIDVSGPASPTNMEKPKDAILVPLLQTPTAFTGRVTNVTYPVHRAVVLGNGIRDCLAYGRFTASADQEIPAHTVKLAIGLPAPQSEPEQSESDAVILVDTSLASSALAKFRESIENSILYERGWFRSGMPALSDWLAEGSKASEDGMKPAVKNLIESLLEDASLSITQEDAQRLRQLLESSIPQSTKQSLLESLRVWAEHAHTELRNQLDMAFAGKHWRKLSWWKLFWRVDDVSMITSEVLERRWVVDAEKGIIWVAGRIEEAGFFKGAGSEGERASLLAPEGPLRRAFGSAPPPVYLSDLVKQDVVDEGEVTPPTLKPWPMQIPVARAELAASTIPAMQALAQKLVLQTLSTTSLTSALSALVYVSVSTTSVFEAGAVAALGLVWSMRNMQKKWEAARAFCEREIREEGRKALKETEDRVRAIIEMEGQPKSDPEGAEDRRVARGAVARAQEALAKASRS